MMPRHLLHVYVYEALLYLPAPTFDEVLRGGRPHGVRAPIADVIHDVVHMQLH